MEITFIQLLSSKDKVSALHELISKVSHGKMLNSVFIINDKLFRSIDKCPLAYYAPQKMLLLSGAKQVLNAKGVVACQGIGASTRFHRLLWEVPVNNVGKAWLHMVHGTSPAKFYKPTTHLFLWADDGREAKADVTNRYPYLKGNYGFKIQAEEFYRKPGLCYGKRTDHFTVQILPPEHVFSFEGTAIFTDGTRYDEWVLLAILNSNPVNHWLSIVCAEHKAYNYIEAIPAPEVTNESCILLRKLAQEGWYLRRDLDICNLASPMFVTTILVQHNAHTLASSIDIYKEHFTKTNMRLVDIQNKIDEVCFQLYELAEPVIPPENDFEIVMNEDTELKNQSIEDKEDNFYRDIPEIVSQLIDYLIGGAFGLWDIRIPLDSTVVPSLPDPFDPLPICSPGMLIGTDGLPARPDNIVSEEWLRKRADGGMKYADGKWSIPEGDNSLPTASDYPLRISWPGILVDDEDHSEDIVRRLREALDVLWGEHSEAIEQEACSILGVKSLRDYFRSPSGFFQDHLKRYSKSRRKAPIYWPLSTASGSYTLWIYYHRLTDQTLYLCITDYVNPKLDDTKKDIERLQTEMLMGGTASQRSILEKLIDFEQELKDFRDELLRVAKLPYTPNLNDGVMITASPLWKLFRHTSWRKDLEECWWKLETGEYDWAHIAYTMWPERIKEKCKADKSIAIAHDLEHLYEEKAVEPKKPRKSKNKTGGTLT